MLYIFLIIIALIIIVIINSTDEKGKYKIIDFKSKKKYLCCIFLYGNCNLKTNKAVLSRNSNKFLLETESNDCKLESFSFDYDDIENIDINPNISSKSGETLWNNFTTSDRPGRYTTFTSVETIKYYKIYEIKIKLKNNVDIHLQSTKSPYFIFKAK